DRTLTASGVQPRPQQPSLRVPSVRRGSGSPASEGRPSSQFHGRLNERASHRIPAPSVRAIDAMMANAMVKRARFAFTESHLVCRCVIRPAAGLPWGGLRFMPRSLALRPRLAAGLPWTVCPTEDVCRPRAEPYGPVRSVRTTHSYGSDKAFGGVSRTHRPD